MFPIVRDLLVLQDCDQRIRSLSKDLKDIPRLELHAKSRLENETAAVNAAHERMRAVELKIKAVELDVQTRRTSITRIKDQQFATRKNEEFRALAHEAERYEKEVSALEDQELELMEQLDTIKPDLAAAQAELALTQKSIDEELAALHERAEAIKARLTELNTQRLDLIKPIDATTLSLYDRLIKSKGGNAVVPMSEGICGGCHVRVVSGTIQSLKANQSITHCEQCGRILYQN
jgi:predicted  nucleic acid-binding Zn-ribbon protein